MNVPFPIVRKPAVLAPWTVIVPPGRKSRVEALLVPLLRMTPLVDRRSSVPVSPNVALAAPVNVMPAPAVLAFVLKSSVPSFDQVAADREDVRGLGARAGGLEDSSARDGDVAASRERPGGRVLELENAAARTPSGRGRSRGVDRDGAAASDRDVVGRSGDDAAGPGGAELQSPPGATQEIASRGA